jgi:hypothetical protein
MQRSQYMTRWNLPGVYSMITLIETDETPFPLKILIFQSRFCIGPVVVAHGASHPSQNCRSQSCTWKVSQEHYEVHMCMYAAILNLTETGKSIQTDARFHHQKALSQEPPSLG